MFSLCGVRSSPKCKTRELHPCLGGLSIHTCRNCPGSMEEKLLFAQQPHAAIPLNSYVCPDGTLTLCHKTVVHLPHLSSKHMDAATFSLAFEMSRQFHDTIVVPLPAAALLSLPSSITPPDGAPDTALNGRQGALPERVRQSVRRGPAAL